MSWSPRITSSASLEPILASTIRRCRSPALLTLTSDRKSTRLNSSHSQISYAVFCLKKKKELTHSVIRPVLGHGAEPPIGATVGHGSEQVPHLSLLPVGAGPHAVGGLHRQLLARPP